MTTELHCIAFHLIVDQGETLNPNFLGHRSSLVTCGCELVWGDREKSKMSSDSSTPLSDMAQVLCFCTFCITCADLSIESGPYCLECLVAKGLELLEIAGKAR